MGVIQETLPYAAIYNNPQQLVLSATAAITLGTTAAKGMEIVHRGEMGVRLRKGRPIEKRNLDEINIEEDGQYKIVDQGLYFLVPFIDKISKINVMDRSDPLPEFEIETKDGQQLKVNSSVTWHVRADGDNPFKALFNVNNEKDNKDKDKILELKQTVLGVCTEGLGRVLSGRTSPDLLELDYEAVKQQTEEVCHDDLLEYGVALKSVRLQPIARTNPEVLKQGLESSNNPILKHFISSAKADENGKGAIIPLSPRDAS